MGTWLSVKVYLVLSKPPGVIGVRRARPLEQQPHESKVARRVSRRSIIEVPMKCHQMTLAGSQRRNFRRGLNSDIPALGNHRKGRGIAFYRIGHCAIYPVHSRGNPKSIAPLSLQRPWRQVGTDLTVLFPDEQTPVGRTIRVCASKRN